MVISAKCNRRGLPFPNKLYAVKILFNDTGLRTKDIRDAYENEWEILSRIRSFGKIRFCYFHNFLTSDWRSMNRFDTFVAELDLHF